MKPKSETRDMFKVYPRAVLNNLGKISSFRVHLGAVLGLFGDDVLAEVDQEA